LRDHLSTIEMDIGRSILSVEKGLASLEELPEEEDVYEEEEEEEAEDRQPPSRPTPRRASLAADTMGGPKFQQDSMQGRE